MTTWKNERSPSLCLFPSRCSIPNPCVNRLSCHNTAVVQLNDLLARFSRGCSIILDTLPVTWTDHSIRAAIEQDYRRTSLIFLMPTVSLLSLDDPASIWPTTSCRSIKNVGFFSYSSRWINKTTEIRMTADFRWEFRDPYDATLTNDVSDKKKKRRKEEEGSSSTSTCLTFNISLILAFEKEPSISFPSALSSFQFASPPPSVRPINHFLTSLITRSPKLILAGIDSRLSAAVSFRLPNESRVFAIEKRTSSWLVLRVITRARAIIAVQVGARAGHSLILSDIIIKWFERNGRRHVNHANT